METITENHNWTECRAQGTVGNPALVASWTAHVLQVWFRSLQGRGRRLKEPVYQEVCCDTVSSRNDCMKKNGETATSIVCDNIEVDVLWDLSLDKELQVTNNC